MFALTFYFSGIQRSKFSTKDVGEQVCREKLDLQQVLLFLGPEEAICDVSARNRGFKVDKDRVLALFSLLKSALVSQWFEADFGQHLHFWNLFQQSCLLFRNRSCLHCLSSSTFKW